MSIIFYIFVKNKTMKKIITILLCLLLFSYNFSYAKTRSDKGKHHKHHNNLYDSEKGKSIDESKTSSISDESKTSSISDESGHLLVVVSFLVLGAGLVFFLTKKNKPKISDWANNEGLIFHNKLREMVNNNESIKMSEIDEIKNLPIITKKSVNEIFEVKEGDFDMRIWILILILNDRYESENKDIVGLSDKEVLDKYSFNIKSDEILFEVFEDCGWYELKRNGQVSTFQGLGLRIPLGGGLSYKVGALFTMNPSSSEYYREVSKGTLLLTNKRIVFNGLSENKSINLESVIDINLFKDSVIIGKSTGKKPLIKFDMDDAAIFSRVITRLF
jgi:hypothetical protein